MTAPCPIDERQVSTWVSSSSYHDHTSDMIEMLEGVPSTPLFPGNAPLLTFSNSYFVGCNQTVVGSKNEDDLDDLEYFCATNLLDCCAFCLVSENRRGLFHVFRESSNKEIRSFAQKFDPSRTQVHLITSYLSIPTQKCAEILKQEGFTLSTALYDPVFGILEEVRFYNFHIKLIFPQNPGSYNLGARSVAIHLSSGKVYGNIPPPKSSLQSLFDSD